MPTAVASEFALLDTLFDELFPICRSLMGPGFRESLEIVRRHLPLQVETVPCGTRVFDWTVPQEWRIHGARLTGPDGSVLADFDTCNLHVVNYSQPIDVQLDLDALRPHLHSLPQLPDAVPYVTSYHAPNWGFCLPHRVLQSLQPGTYHARIDSSFVAGHLDFATGTLPGESDQEILLSSYLCHPSMANNELSGPLVMIALYRRLAAWPRRRYTYRFTINPETLGTLCFLQRYGDHLRRHLVGGMVLSCLGGPWSHLTYRRSRLGNSLLDRTATQLVTDEAWPLAIEPFTPVTGSEERQYCSPGFNLPVALIRRTRDGEYPEYHSSADDKAFMGIDRIIESVDQIEALLQRFEIAGHFVNQQPFGEPQLGRRNLYPTINAPLPDTLDTQLELKHRQRMLQLLSDSDGRRPVLHTAAQCGCRLEDLAPIIAQLEAADLLRFAGAHQVTPAWAAGD